jgi:hypothetical protein
MIAQATPSVCTWGALGGGACGQPATWRLNPEACDDPPLGEVVTAFMLRFRVCEAHRGPRFVFEDGQPLWVRA